MPVLTKYHSLSNSELIRQLENARLASPIISELCERLSEKPDDYVGFDTNTKCPACEASLVVVADEEDNLFTLEVKK